jgi:UDP-N-acetyl-2-amino-2-deoxyglucuronate dehydrogenase
MNFAIIGPSGYIASRHISAISSLNGKIVSYHDISEYHFSNLDNQPQYYKNKSQFFESLVEDNIDFVAICSPNHLHCEQICLALQQNINVICEKPLIFNEKQLNTLEDSLVNSSADVYGIMQLRVHPVIKKLDRLFQDIGQSKFSEGKLTFITKRDENYKNSWKVSVEKSGGILFNLGIHYFDIVLKYFGLPLENHIIEKSLFRIKGISQFKNFKLNWFISIDDCDVNRLESNTLREFVFDDLEIDFSSVSNDLHYLNYQEIINNKNFNYDSLKSTHQFLININNG